MRFLASKRSRPAYSPASAVIFPLPPMTTTAGRPWRLPDSKSLASWAGVTFTMPVPNSRSTRIGSSMIGISRFMIGRVARRPRSPAVRASSGWIASAVSPSIVSGRVVATIAPPGTPATS